MSTTVDVGIDVNMGAGFGKVGVGLISVGLGTVITVGAKVSVDEGVVMAIVLDGDKVARDKFVVVLIGTGEATPQATITAAIGIM